MNKKSSWMIIIIFSISIFYVVYEQDFGLNYSYAEKIKNKCSLTVPCAVDELATLSLEEPKKTVLETYDELIELYKGIETFCHEPGHLMGSFFYIYLGDVKESLSRADPKICGGGLIHAVVQTHMIEQALNKNPSLIDITAICRVNPDNSQDIERWECIHGIGHGLTSIYNSDVPTAVERCKEFSEEWEKTRCSGGVFMENLIIYYETGFGDIDENDIFYPCTEMEDDYAPSCYIYHAQHIVNLDPQDEESISMCEQAQEEFVKYCYRGYAIRNSEKVYEEQSSVPCKLVPHIYKTDCYMGTVAIYAKQVSPQAGLEFCKNIPDEFKADCYSEVGKITKMIHSDEYNRTKECSMAENSNYTEICLKAKLGGKSFIIS